VLLIPPLFNPNYAGVPVASDRPCWVGERMGLKLFGREIIFEEFQPMGKSAPENGVDLWRRFLECVCVSCVSVTDRAAVGF